MSGFVRTHHGKRMQLPRHIWHFVSALRTRFEPVMSWHKSQGPIHSAHENTSRGSDVITEKAETTANEINGYLTPNRS